MKDIKEKLSNIIEKSCGSHTCKNCKSYCDGTCTFNCVNERNMGMYRFSNKKVTSPEYTCDNFNGEYNLSESTLDILRDLVKDIDRINEGMLNLDLLLNGKMDESDFIDIMK